jgi:hypothetical protein
MRALSFFALCGRGSNCSSISWREGGGVHVYCVILLLSILVGRVRWSYSSWKSSLWNIYFNHFYFFISKPNIIPLCRRMLGSNPGLLRRWHWQTLYPPRLDLISSIMETYARLYQKLHLNNSSLEYQAETNSKLFHRQEEAKHKQEDLFRN